MIPFNKDSCTKAIKFFDIAISLDKKTRAVTNKTEALLCLEDFDAALSEADMAEKNNSCFAHSLKARAYKGRFLKKHDSLDKKIAIMEATDYMECDHSGINLFRDIMRTMKDFDSTEKYLKHDVELKPYERMSYYFYYEFLLLRTDEGYMKDTDISEAERIIKEGKANTNFIIGAMWEVYLHRANVLFKRKESDRALFEYTEALAGNPNLSYLKERMSSLCSQFTDDRCIKSWQKIIRAYIDRGDCVKADQEFKIQYSNHPTAFEQMKEAVYHCKEKIIINSTETFN
jgi:tetratricopeptide (TPR) repeat protein